MHENKGGKYANTLTQVKEAAVQSTDLLLCEMIRVVRMKDVTQQTQFLGSCENSKWSLQIR